MRTASHNLTRGRFANRVTIAAKRIEEQSPAVPRRPAWTGPEVGVRVPPAAFSAGQGVFVRDRAETGLSGPEFVVRAAVVVGKPEFRREMGGKWARWVYRVVVGDEMRTLPETRVFRTEAAALAIGGDRG